MKELWEQAVLPYNLPLTILLGLVVCFWLLTLLGAVSTDSLDGNIDGDVDAGSDAGDIPSMMLRVVNAGYVPLTIVLSILVLAMWMISIILNYYLNPGQSLWLAVGYLALAFVVGVIATKLITQPLVPLMRRLKDAENVPPVIGAIGIVRSIQLDSTYGQVEVQRVDGAPALLNARLSAGCESVVRGTAVAIVSQDETSGIYVARPVPAIPPID